MPQFAICPVSEEHFRPSPSALGLLERTSTNPRKCGQRGKEEQEPLIEMESL